MKSIVSQRTSSHLMLITLASLAVVACGTAVSPGVQSGVPASAIDASSPDGVATESNVRPWIDTHTHPSGIHSECSTQECVNAVVKTMDAFGLRKAILIHPPSPSGVQTSECESLTKDAVALRPDRFLLGVGGCELNAKVQATSPSGVADAAMRAAFREAAERLISTPGAIAFGEMAALHLSYEPSHAFEEISASADLFGELAAVAASHKAPIDLHMDVVSATKTTPTFYTSRSALNPAQIKENVSGLEQLLSSNPNTAIVWAHVGRDTTGDLTLDLIDRLLKAHENLFIQLAPNFGPLGSANAILDANSVVRPEWVSLISKYSSRVLIGSDTFFSGTTADEKQLRVIQQLLKDLPEDVAYRVGCENAVRIYRLPSGC